jgi:valyl-tRNA synthetase
VLERGLNYAIAPHKIPKFEIIKSIETAAVRLAPEKAEDYRAKIKKLIGNCRRLKSNVTDQEEKAIQQLAKDKNIKILKADKDNVTVVMDTKEYERKLTEMVSTEEYKKLEKDPTRAIEAKVQKSLKPIADDISQT